MYGCRGKGEEEKNHFVAELCHSNNIFGKYLLYIVKEGAGVTKKKKLS